MAGFRGATRPGPKGVRPPIDRVLCGMSNGELDRLFRSSPAGAIPSGRTRGTAMIATGTWLCRPVAWLVRRLLWRGAIVNSATGHVCNIVTPVRIEAVRALVTVGPSRVDGRDCLVIDYAGTSLVARRLRDELRLVAPHLYLGVVWFGRRRVAWFTLRSPGGTGRPFSRGLAARRIRHDRVSTRAR